MGAEPEIDIDALIGTSNAAEGVTDAELADFLGMATRNVRDLAQRGVIKRCAPNRYVMRDAVRAYCASIREAASGRSSNGTLSNEKLRYEKARADAQEMKNAATSGRLVLVAEVERAWSAVLRDVRSGMLSIPARVQQQLGTLTAHDVDTIDREIRKALEEMADG